LLRVILWEKPYLIHKERQLTIKRCTGAHNLFSARRARRSALAEKMPFDHFKTRLFRPMRPEVNI